MNAKTCGVKAGKICRVAIGVLLAVGFISGENCRVCLHCSSLYCDGSFCISANNSPGLFSLFLASSINLSFVDLGEEKSKYDLRALPKVLQKLVLTPLFLF